MKKFFALAVMLFVAAAFGGCVNKSSGIGNMEVVDLTAMNRTMILAYVYDMMLTRPEFYVGKVVKMNGAYTYDNGKNLIVFWDAIGCCTTEIEFKYNLEYEIGGYDDIHIEGIFTKGFNKYGYKYYYITATTLELI